METVLERECVGACVCAGAIERLRERERDRARAREREREREGMEREGAARQQS